MTPRWLGALTLMVLLSPLCVAQSAGFGGVGGFGGNGGLGGFDRAGGRRDHQSGKMIWRPWLRLSGYYNEEVTYLDDRGNVATGLGNKAAMGGWGISGTKLVENTALSVGYAGTAIIAQENSAVRGSNHMLQFAANHRFNRNVYAGIQQILGTGHGGFGVGSGFSGFGSSAAGSLQSQLLSPGSLFGFGDPALNGFVDQEIFANRVNFSGTVGTLGYRLNRRSSVSASGGAFLTRRKHRALADANAYMGGANYNYALSRSTEVGAGYSVGNFDYPERFGGNHVQSLNAFVARRFRDNGGVSFTGGATRFDSNFIGVIAVDPELAQILGISAITSVQKARRTTFAGNLSVFYNTDLVNFGFTATRGVIPGNGILYGGVRDLMNMRVSRTLVEGKLIAGLSATAMRTSGVLQRDVQNLYHALASVTYRMHGGFSLTGGGGVRWQRITSTGSYMPSKMATIGLGWSPGETPFLF